MTDTSIARQMAEAHAWLENAGWRLLTVIEFKEVDDPCGCYLGTVWIDRYGEEDTVIKRFDDPQAVAMAYDLACGIVAKPYSVRPPELMP